MLDLLYILGTGSQWGDNELRYSLRSAALYLPHQRVHLYGERPSFVRHVNNVPLRDETDSQQTNAIRKLKVACHLMDKPFWLMNDDFFLLTHLTERRNRHRGYLRDYLVNAARPSVYTQSLWATGRVLRRHGVKRPLNYALHVPMVINPEYAQHVFSVFDEAGLQDYNFRTAYGNLFPSAEIDAEDDVKIKNVWHTPPSGWSSFSTDDQVILDPRCQAFLEFFYPVPSPYESSSTGY